MHIIAWRMQYPITDVGSYVDVLGCLGKRFEDLRHIAVKYLELALTRNLVRNDPSIISNTIAELKNE